MIPQNIITMNNQPPITQTQKSIDIDQIKMKYTPNNTNNLFGYANTFNNTFPSINPFQQLQPQQQPQINTTLSPFQMGTSPHINPFSSTMPITNTLNINNSSTRNEIERIKAKYFNKNESITSNNSTKTALLLEEKLNKYKNMLTTPPIQHQYQTYEPINKKNVILEVNRANNFELNPTNELLISKVSWIEGKLSMSQNKPLVSSTVSNNNNKRSSYIKNKYKNENEMSYNYSNSSDNEGNDNNENDIQPIIDKVDKLKETMREYDDENQIEDNEDHIQCDTNDNNLEAKYIVNNIMNKIPNETENERLNQNWRYDNNNYNYLNGLTLNDLQGNKQQHPSTTSEPKLISKKPFIREGNPMKKKLISFEEFLSLNEDQ